MNFWSGLWIAWLVFLVIADIIANRTDDQTLSEHVQRWFGTFEGRIVLGLFFVSLYIHFAFAASVWPVIYLGALVAVFIGRWYWLAHTRRKEKV